jgi:hypothetical protein
MVLIKAERETRPIRSDRRRRVSSRVTCQWKFRGSGMAAHSHVIKDRPARRICLMDPDKSPNSAGARRAFFGGHATTRPRPTGATRGSVTERGESDSMCGSPRAENRWFSAPMEHEETREETGQVRYRKGRSSGLLLSNGRKRSPNDADSNRLVSPSAAHESSRHAEPSAVRSNRCRKQVHLFYQDAFKVIQI